jgi:cysteine-S-conjugate beta-lyase
MTTRATAWCSTNPLAADTRAGVPAPDPFEQLTLTQLRQRRSAKWRVYPEDVLPLWIAEMDVPLAEPVAGALNHAVDIGDTGYAAGDEYACALGGFAARRWGWDGFRAADARMVPDVMRGIVEVLRLLTEDGDPVVVTAPVYPPFFEFVGHAGRRIVQSPLTAAGRIDLGALADTLAALAARHPRVTLLISNPHNPTGVVHSAGELQAIAEIAAHRHVRVISDEIHAPLVLDGARFTPYLSLRGTEDALAVLSASKAWNLAGLKAAVAVPGSAAVADLARMPVEVTHGPSHLGVLAHTAALNDGEPWLDAVLTGLDRKRRLLTKLLAEHLPQVGYRAPEGTYLAWLDCRALPDVADPYRFFLDRAGVALTSGAGFGIGGTGHLRLNFATSTAILTEAVTRMGRALQ